MRGRRDHAGRHRGPSDQRAPRPALLTSPNGVRLMAMDIGVEPDSLAALRRRREGWNDLPPPPATAHNFARLIAWLTANGLPVTTASLDFLTLVDYVGTCVSGRR